MTTIRERRDRRKRDRLAERGRHLASQREDLIAAGVNPAALAVPLHPDDLVSTSTPSTADHEHATHLREISRVWSLVAAACVGALSGCVAATGTMLAVNQAVTWQAALCAVAALVWGYAAFYASNNARRIRRSAHDLTSPVTRGRA